MSDIFHVETQPRGCGKERDQGGLYITGRMTNFGGVPISEFIHDPLSFERKNIVTKSWMVKLTSDESMGVKFLETEDGYVAILDVIGKESYTAAEFLTELMHLGPSRKVSPGVAEKMAQILASGRSFVWHLIYRECIPDESFWEEITLGGGRCVHKLDNHEPGSVCTKVYFQTLKSGSEPETHVTAAGRAYVLHPRNQEWPETPHSAIMAAFPSDVLRLEGVAKGGQKNKAHEAFEKYEGFFRYTDG